MAQAFLLSEQQQRDSKAARLRAKGMIDKARAVAVKVLTTAMQKLTLKSAAISVLVIQFVKPWIGPVAWHFLRALADHVVVKVLGMTNITIGPVTRTLVKLAKAVTDRMHARRMNTKLTAGTEFTTAINDLGGSLHTNLTAGTEFTTAINDLGGSLHMLHRSARCR